jgi:hypothetical protein
VQGLWQGDLKKAGDALRVTHVAMITPDLWRNFTELHLCRDFGHLSCLAMSEKGDMKKAEESFQVTHVLMITPDLWRNFTELHPVQGLWAPVLPGHERDGRHEGGRMPVSRDGCGSPSATHSLQHYQPNYRFTPGKR